MDSTPGVGTAIKIFWPLFDQPVRSNSSARKLSDSCEGQEVILVVEDDEQLRTFVSSIFTSLGYHALTQVTAIRQKRLPGMVICRSIC